MKKLSREYIKKLVYEALGREGNKNSSLSKTRVKEIIQEEIVKRYGDK
tara:strand:+ start:39 stop:182 length:144 start_codon:yes stop_codon:yes gene_type:complete